MAINKEIASIKRVGPRYGRTTRAKVGRIEHLQRGLHKCPYCNQIKVKRIASGIWQCKKCSSKFTNKAYFVSKTKKRRDATATETTEEVQEEPETQIEETQEEEIEQVQEEPETQIEEPQEEVEAPVEEIQEEVETQVEEPQKEE